jgi:hypothetical protein
MKKILRKFADDTKEVGHTVKDEKDGQQLQNALNNLTGVVQKRGYVIQCKKKIV